jgi:hypothetical protein
LFTSLRRHLAAQDDVTMTFRRGFIITEAAVLTDARTEDASGQVLDPDAFCMSVEGALVQVDESFADKYYLRVRFPAEHAGVFCVGQVFKTMVKDVRAKCAEYAQRRIAEIEKAQGLEDLPTMVAGWVERKARIWWTEQPPQGLSVDQHVTFVAVTENSFTVRPGNGDDVIVPFAGFNLDHISFERSEDEIAEREERLESRKVIPAMTPQQALAWLAQVELFNPFATSPPKISITVSDTGEAFEQACVAFLVQTVQFRGKVDSAREYVKLVNAYTDRGTGVATILLRPGTTGAGTEVHETVHALSPDAFARSASFFINEGTTEYLTRMAVTDKFDRTPFYDTEHFFIERLVEVGATTPEILTQLYFAGNWAAFEEGLYKLAELISIKVFLDRAANGQSYAALHYLDELIAKPNAPLVTR